MFFVVAFWLGRAKIVRQFNEDGVVPDTAYLIPRYFDGRMLRGESEEPVGHEHGADASAVAVDGDIADISDLASVAHVYDILFTKTRVIHSQKNHLP